MPTIEAWEGALFARDTVFFWLAAITIVFVMWAFLFKALKTVFRVVVSIGFVALVGLLIYSTLNMYLWTP